MDAAQLLWWEIRYFSHRPSSVYQNYGCHDSILHVFLFSLPALLSLTPLPDLIATPISFMSPVTTLLNLPVDSALCQTVLCQSTETFELFLLPVCLTSALPCRPGYLCFACLDPSSNVSDFLLHKDVSL